MTRSRSGGKVSDRRRGAFPFDIGILNGGSHGVIGMARPEGDEN